MFISFATKVSFAEFKFEYRRVPSFPARRHQFPFEALCAPIFKDAHALAAKGNSHLGQAEQASK